jgi:molecular chaperone GrpE
MNDTKPNYPEDAAMDAEDSGYDPAEAEQSVAEPVDQISALEEQIADLKNQVLRALADAENTRRRAAKEREDTAKYAVSKFARDLVDVSDNLRRALDAIPAETVQENETMRTLIVGIEGIERQIESAFEHASIKRIEPIGELYDPNFHQVMMELENTGKPPGTVVQVLQAGYIIHDRLLREAIVGVAKGEPVERKVNTLA